MLKVVPNTRARWLFKIYLSRLLGRPPAANRPSSHPPSWVPATPVNPVHEPPARIPQWVPRRRVSSRTAGAPGKTAPRDAAPDSSRNVLVPGLENSVGNKNHRSCFRGSSRKHGLFRSSPLARPEQSARPSSRGPSDREKAPAPTAPAPRIPAVGEYLARRRPPGRIGRVEVPRTGPRRTPKWGPIRESRGAAPKARAGFSPQQILFVPENQKN